MKLKKQVTVCGGAIFCVAVFSLYLMLDRVQHDPARRQNGGNFPRVSVIVIYVGVPHVVLVCRLIKNFGNIILCDVP